jgi:copper chaperone
MGQGHDDGRKELLMQVEGMACEGCIAAVTRAVRRLDPGADVEVDLDHGRARILTTREAIEVSDALTKAGYEAHGMTG